MLDFREVANGPLEVWHLPESRRKYTIGIDTSTGLSKDWTVMQVLTNTIPHEQVAMFRAKWSVVDSAAFAVQLGLFYNTAMIIVETNYPGNAVQDALIQTYKYPRNYQAEQHLDESPNISSKYGFTTTQASKWLLIREMQEALEKKAIIMNDIVTIDEFGTYVFIEDKSKTGAAQGLNDDCVMAMMLAYHAAMLWPQNKVRKKQPINLHDDIRQQRDMLARFTEQMSKKPKVGTIQVM